MSEFNNFLNSLIHPKHYLLIDKQDKIEGWAAVFSAETVRCFFIMVNSAAQGHGYGTLLLTAVKADERSLFGWVIDHDNDIKANGQSYRSPLNFYVKNNFYCKYQPPLGYRSVIYSKYSLDS